MKGIFVAINYITCSPAYKERIEQLFLSRAHAIDKEPGFIRMEVLRPQSTDDPYLIISHWKDEKYFDSWTKSEAFIEGHRRGFEDLAKAKAEGKQAPMSSRFKTYKVLGE